MLSILSSNGLLDNILLVMGSLAILQAVQTALQRLEEGCSIEDAKAICEPGIVHQLFVWQVETNYPKYLFKVLVRKHSCIFT